jgi:hypothetical protein
MERDVSGALLRWLSMPSLERFSDRHLLYAKLHGMLRLRIEFCSRFFRFSNAPTFIIEIYGSDCHRAFPSGNVITVW